MGKTEVSEHLSLYIAKIALGELYAVWTRNFLKWELILTIFYILTVLVAVGIGLSKLTVLIL